MDADKQKALATFKRLGLPGMEELLALYPVLRHASHVHTLFSSKRHEIECQEEWEKWFQTIPAITFDPGWKVQMRPPITGAIVRFKVENVSVYLDCYSILGSSNGPYWELYPAEDGDTERYDMMDVDGLLDGLRRAIKK